MFSRRRPKNARQKLRDLVWPRMGWRRLVRYYGRRMGRLPGSPYFIAAGFASGVAVSVTPFLGLHILLGALCCWFVRGSMVAMVIGTIVAGNPWTFPLTWMGTYQTGHWLMGNADMLREARALGAGAGPQELSLRQLLQSPMELLVPMTIGCLPYLVPLWLLSFYAARRVVAGYRLSAAGPGGRDAA